MTRDDVIDLCAQGMISKVAAAQVITMGLSKEAKSEWLRNLARKLRLIRPKVKEVGETIKGYKKIKGSDKMQEYSTTVFKERPIYKQEGANLIPSYEATPFGKVVGIGGGGMVLAAGAHGLGTTYSRIKEKFEAKRGWKRVLSENPDLKRLDQKVLKKNFRVLAKFSPEMATEPTVAGSFLRQQGLRADIGIDPKTVKDLIGARKDYLAGQASKGMFGGALRALAGN